MANKYTAHPVPQLAEIEHLYFSENMTQREIGTWYGVTQKVVTTAKRYEWANISGEYLGVDDFKRLCKSCHAKFDGVGRNFLCKSSR